MTFLARSALAIGFLLFSATPLTIGSQTAAVADTVDPVQTASIAPAAPIVPATPSINRDTKVDLPISRSVALAAPSPDRDAFLSATGGWPAPPSIAPVEAEAMVAALSVRPPQIFAPAIELPSPADAVLAIDPNGPIAYADPGGAADLQAPFNALFNPSAKPDSVHVVPDPLVDHSWVANPIPEAARSTAETRCLAEAIYFESRSEPIRGQLAVAQVVINRLKNPAYPGTICGVVYQNANYRNACQFSFACDGIRDVVRDQLAWATSLDLARSVLSGEAIWLEEIGASTHYHATYVRAHWAPSMQRMAQIGLHVFYRTYGGGWI